MGGSGGIADLTSAREITQNGVSDGRGGVINNSFGFGPPQVGTPNTGVSLRSSTKEIRRPPERGV